ncbi:hypothetical protein CPB85DRAFT_1250330 [Mucidula mucida]|nr:hypothetical protein CPB85DRAFT_1250330 [Mucidula mucida]
MLSQIPLFAFTLLSVASAQLKEPTFTKLYDVQLLADVTRGRIIGPFGERSIVAWQGGNFTEPGTSNLVAQVIPGLGGEFGLLGSNAAFYADGRAAVQYVGEDKFAYIEIHGVDVNSLGTETHNLVHFEVDPDSPHVDLVSKFLFLSLNIAGNPLIGSLYQLDD